MSVFICYSHEDKDFVDTLARILVRNKTHVWLDKWELKVGDSLIQRIQDAITEADALLVVLSNASIKSEWCKRELSAATIRELNEKKVLVLPVLIEDCEIPLLLQEKVYADFRTDFREGTTHLLESIASITSETLGRITDKEYLTDFSFSWGFKEELYYIEIFLISLPNDLYPISILTTANITANKSATKKLLEIEETGIKEYAKNIVLGAFLNSEVLKKDGLSVELKDSEPLGTTVSLTDPNGTDEYTLLFEVRRLGENTGKNVLFHTGDVLHSAFEQSRDRARQLTYDELVKVTQILGLVK